MGDHHPLGVAGAPAREEEDVGVGLAERRCPQIVVRLDGGAVEQVGPGAGHGRATCRDPLDVGQRNPELLGQPGPGGGSFTVGQQQGRTGQAGGPGDLLGAQQRVERREDGAQLGQGGEHHAPR